MEQGCQRERMGGGVNIAELSAKQNAKNPSAPNIRRGMELAGADSVPSLLRLHYMDKIVIETYSG
jgi:hypothetical protein